MNLSRCTALEHLPDGLTVRDLNLSGCTRLGALPAGAAASLQHLSVSGCTRLTTLPEQLTHLEDLDISDCSSLTSLPDGIRVRSRIELAGTALTGLPWSLRSTRLLWGGMPVSDRVAFDPQGITAADVLYEENQELRRLMLQRMGLERFVQESRAEVFGFRPGPRGPEAALAGPFFQRRGPGLRAGALPVDRQPLSVACRRRCCPAARRSPGRPASTMRPITSRSWKRSCSGSISLDGLPRPNLIRSTSSGLPLSSPWPWLSMPSSPTL